MRSNYTPLVLSPTLWGKIKVLSFDFFMLLQLVLLYIACLILWPICFFEERVFKTDKVINGFILFVAKIANFKV